MKNNKQFSSEYKPTEIMDALYKEIIIDDSVVKVSMWDTSGKKSLDSKNIGTLFFENTHCLILVFDLTDLKSFESIEVWRNGFLKRLDPKDPKAFPCVLIGNKCDEVENRKVSQERIINYCKVQSNMSYFETSVKENINVESAFDEVFKLALENNLKAYEFYYRKKNPKLFNKMMQIIIKEKENKENNDKKKISPFSKIEKSKGENNSISINKSGESNEEKKNRISKPTKLREKNNEKPIAIIFISTDQQIHYALPCNRWDLFSSIENELYIEYPELKNKNICFIANGQVINKSETLEQNKIKNSTTILINYID